MWNTKNESKRTCGLVMVHKIHELGSYMGFGLCLGVALIPVGCPSPTCHKLNQAHMMLP